MNKKHIIDEVDVAKGRLKTADGCLYLLTKPIPDCASGLSSGNQVWVSETSRKSFVEIRPVERMDDLILAIRHES